MTVGLDFGEDQRALQAVSGTLGTPGTSGTIHVAYNFKYYL